jgi:hypothetical protein
MLISLVPYGLIWPYKVFHQKNQKELSMAKPRNNAPKNKAKHNKNKNQADPHPQPTKRQRRLTMQGPGSAVAAMANGEMDNRGGKGRRDIWQRHFQ